MARERKIVFLESLGLHRFDEAYACFVRIVKRRLIRMSPLGSCQSRIVRCSGAFGLCLTDGLVDVA